MCDITPFVAQGDLQSQAAVRAIARQVCEQLIQSESTVISVILFVFSSLTSTASIVLLSIIISIKIL